MPIKRFVHRRRWWILGTLGVLGISIGITAGVGTYTFVYAKGYSYLTNDPKACANCHVMENHFAAWTKSSHHAVAVCNDCHAPKNFVGKWMTKGINGWNHSLAFTTQHFHEPIEITSMNIKVTENACRRCHESIVRMIDPPHAGGSKMSCIRCHSTVGHME